MSTIQSSPPEHRRSFTSTLRGLGADLYNMMLPETYVLAGLLAPGEIVEGIVYGRYHRSNGSPGRGALVATDRRVVFVDRKPMSLNASEISYQVVSGISYGTTGMVSTVALNTRIGDIHIRTFNSRTAATFVHAIEDHIFTQPADFRPLRQMNPVGSK